MDRIISIFYSIHVSQLFGLVCWFLFFFFFFLLLLLLLWLRNRHHLEILILDLLHQLLHILYLEHTTLILWRIFHLLIHILQLFLKRVNFFQQIIHFLFSYPFFFLRDILTKFPILFYWMFSFFVMNLSTLIFVYSSFNLL